MDWKKLADKQTVEKVMDALAKRNIDPLFVQTGEEAKEKTLSMIPQGKRVLTSASITAETIGLKDEIDKGDKFVSVRDEYMTLDREKDADQIRKLRSTPDVIIGSVQAVTLDGQVLIASNTGSQIGAYAYSAPKVIWIVGTQKIVKDLDEAYKRLSDYVVPLEDEHMKGLGAPGTNVSKVLIFDEERTKGRVTLIFVNEALGF